MRAPGSHTSPSRIGISARAREKGQNLEVPALLGEQRSARHYGSRWVTPLEFAQPLPAARSLLTTPVVLSV